MNVFRNKIKHLIAIMILLAIIINVMMISSLTFATSMSSTETVSTGQIEDVTAPRGRIKLLNAEVKNGTNYVSGTEIEVEIYASDDKCTASEIKYYLSTTPIAELGEIADESWKSYSVDGTGKCIEKITISGEEANNIYAVFKDATGNISAIYNGEDIKYEVVYDTGLELQDGSGGGMPTGINTTGYYGMPFVVTSQIPKKEGYSFKGWSTNPNATVGSYGPGSIIPANVFKGAGKTITLNAIFKSDKIVDIENLGEIELSNPDAELNYNPDTGELGGAVPPLGNVPETPPEIPEENLPEIIEFGYGTFESNTEYTPGTYETIEYDVTYTRPKYPVAYNRVVWSKWMITQNESGDVIKTEPGEINLADIEEYYSKYIVYDFETEEALETNGVKGDSVELWMPVLDRTDDSSEDVVYLAAYLNKTDGKTTRHIAKWDGTKYVEYDADEAINTVDTFVDTYTITETRNLQITAPEVNEVYVYIPVGTLNAEEGMTWTEWLESDYNTTGEKEPVIRTIDFEDVAYEDVIVAGQEYGFVVPREKAPVSMANAPIIDNSLMQAVYWNEDGTFEYESDVFTTDMYNYTAGDGVTDTKQAKWANAKTEDGSYWVWIPRYAYKITYYEDKTKTVESGDKTYYSDIDILFMYGTSNTEYRDKNGMPQALPDGFKVHPSFQAMTTAEDLATNPLGKWDTELEGIWVAKYEASEGTTGKVEVKPSVQSWQGINISEMYANSINMYTELNSHMMKNSEWGAAAYLAYSEYGRNGNNVLPNTCTGCYTGAGTSLVINSAGLAGDIYASYEYNENFTNTYAWNTTKGKLSSTTGNIYGIYDMAGGSNEYVASYINNGNSNLDGNGSKLVNSNVLKNKQIYYTGETDSSKNNFYTNIGIYGDGMSEIGFHADYSSLGKITYPYTTSPFVSRGTSWYGYTAGLNLFDANIFDAAGVSGKSLLTGGSSHQLSFELVSFRPVLCISSSSNAQNNVKITYESNNSSGAKIIKIAKLGEEYTLVANMFEAEQFKKLVGWEINGTNYAVGNTIVIEKELTAKAIWSDFEATIAGIEDSYVYTGTAIQPEPTVYENGIKLVKDKDYKLTYGENIGTTGTVTIEFIGNYGGSITKEFIINEMTDGKHAEFTFGNNTSTEVVIDNVTYVMPNVSVAVENQIGNIIINGETVYYPIVEMVMSDGKTSHGTSWYRARYPIFDNVVIIKDYTNDGTEAYTIYDGTTTILPEKLTVISDIAGTEDVTEIFKYNAEDPASSTPVVRNNILYYESAELQGNSEAYETVVKWKYVDTMGKVYYYYVGYYAPAQTGSCITPDTLITLSDGSQKRIDEVTYEDKLLVWDFEKGEYITTVPVVLYNHGEANNRVIHLTFDDGTVLKLIGTHDLFSANKNEFVAINEFNVASYVGDTFVKANIQSNLENNGTNDLEKSNTYTIAKLIDYKITEEYIGSYSILTAKHLNCITEGMLSRSPSPDASLEDFFDFFKVGDNMKYDEEAMKKDIETYGLYTYEDYKDYVTYEQFIALNGAYYKILVGKGYMTFDDVIKAISVYVPEENK